MPMMTSRGSFRLSEIRCQPGRLSLDGDDVPWLDIMGREDVSRADYSIWFLLNNRTSTRLAVGSGFGSAETTTGEGSWGNLRGGVGDYLLGSVPACMAAKVTSCSAAMSRWGSL